MKNSYPSKYEIYQALTEMTSASFVRKFAQKKGLFVMNAKQSELANEITKLLLEEVDIENIRQEAYQQKITHSLSGFTIKSDDIDFSAVEIYNQVFEKGHKQGVTLTALHKVKDTEIYKGTYKYKKNRPGRIELLQGEENEFDFYITKSDDELWKIEVDSTKSTDLKEIKNLFEINTGKEVKVDVIDDKILSPEKSVNFFDGLSDFGQEDGWVIKQIKHITIKKSSNDDEITVEESDLDGINQALLEGNNLRENTFVTSAVESQFMFSAMTYEFENVNSPRRLEIKAEFKGRPKVFEITIMKYSEILGVSGTLQESSLSEKENREYRSRFWNFARLKFEEIKFTK